VFREAGANQQELVLVTDLEGCLLGGQNSAKFVHGAGPRSPDAGGRCFVWERYH
jgi:hypothetical protein